jgi:dTDP-4-amino-4,6-dideoxygalactose transaminase
MAIHLEASYAASGAELPHTEAAARDHVLLPLFPGLTDEQQDFVVDRIAHHTAAVVVT